MDSPLSFENVTFNRRSWQLGPISAAFPAGSITSIVGGSGSGKSTLLRLAVGLLDATSGVIRREVRSASEKHPQYSMVFQDYTMYPHLSLRENGVLAFQVGRPAADARATRIAEVGSAVGIGALLDRRPDTISGGERQRGAILKTIISGAEIWALDEPLSNLDAPVRFHVRSVMRDAQKAAGATVLWVTHDVTEALTVADRVLVLQDGKLLQLGPVAEVVDHPAHLDVARLLFGAGFSELPGALSGPPETLIVTLANGRSFAVAAHSPVECSRVIVAVDVGAVHLCSASACGAHLHLEGTIDALERTARDTLYHVQTPAGGLRMSVRTNSRIGTLATVDLQPSALRFYDAISGHLLPLSAT